MSGELGRKSLLYSVELMLKTRKIRNLQFIRYTTCNHDDKEITFNFYLKYFNLYTCHSFAVTTILPIEQLSPTIKTSEIIDIFGHKNQTWKSFFLYANDISERQIAAPDIHERLISSKIFFNKKYKLAKLLNKYYDKYPEIDIVLQVTNNYRLTKKCISSLYAKNGAFFNLIIIYNCADDLQLKKYIENLPKKFCNIKIIRTNKSLDHVTALNIGLEESNSDYAAIINTTLSFAPNWLKQLKAGFQCADNIGIVGANIKNSPPLTDNKRYTSFSEHNWLWGDCLLLKKSMLVKIGNFNSKFTQLEFYADIDLCFRARNNGYKIILAEDCFISKQKTVPFDKNKEEHYLSLSKIWGQHQFFKELPAALHLAQASPKVIDTKEIEDLAKPIKSKIKIATIAMQEYANISHRITDQDNLNYFKDYFDITFISEEQLRCSLIDFFNLLTTENISFIFLNTTFDPSPLFTYRNDHSLPIGFIVWPYIFEPLRDRYQRLAAQAKPIDTFLAFSSYLKNSFQQVSLNFSLLEMAGPIDVARFTESNLNTEPLVLAYCGRLTPKKNLHILLGLLGASKSALQFKLNIICPLEKLKPDENKYLELLQQIINRFELKENIFFHGDCATDQAKRNQILENSNVLAFLSTDSGETFGRAIVEGMAAGCAILTTNWQAVNELVIDGENGFKIEIKKNIPDTQQLLSALLLLADHKIRQTIQQLNRAKAQEYDYRVQLPKLVKFLIKKIPPTKNLPQTDLATAKRHLSAELPDYIKKNNLELAIYFNDIEQINKSKQLNYKFIYCGSEFCEQLIPSLENIFKLINYCKKNKKTLVLLTPLITNQGLEKIKKIFFHLPENCEVVINDWGLLSLLKKYKLTARLGRLLVKTKREPRGMETADAKIKEYLRTSNLEEEIFQEFLLKNNIKGIELDNTWQGYNVSLPADFSNSLYLPYVYITTTRKCLLKKDKNCRQECRQKYLEANLRKYDAQILISGNTQFYTNKNLPDRAYLQKLKISRLVYFY